MTQPSSRIDQPHDQAPDVDLLPAARSQWLAAAVKRMRHRPFVTAAWLYGSLAADGGDAYSDIDLVVAFDPSMPPDVLEDPVTGLGLPGRILFIRSKPRNAPAGGGYRAVCVEVAGLPLLVDVCLWPAATAAMPDGSRLLHSRVEPSRSHLGFIALLDRHRTADTRGADPAAPENVLYLVQLAAKYLARSDVLRQTAIHQQLQIPASTDVAALRRIVDERVDLTAHPGLRRAAAAAHRLLDVTDVTARRSPHAPTEAVAGRAPGDHREQRGE